MRCKEDVALYILHEAVKNQIVVPKSHKIGTPLEKQFKIYVKSIRRKASLKLLITFNKEMRDVLKIIKKSAWLLEKNYKYVVEKYRYIFFAEGDWVPKYNRDLHYYGR